MRVTSSTDGKYIGHTIASLPSVGDILLFGDFSLEVQFVKTLDTGEHVVGNPNFQIAFKE